MQSHRLYLVFVVAMLLSLTSCFGFEDSFLRGHDSVAAQVTAQAGSEAIYHPASVNTITVTQYSNLTNALAAVNNGQADVFGHRINASDYGLVGGYSNLKQQWAYDSLACMLVINSGISPLNDSHLRRAIAFAVDKLDIASAAMQGRVDPIDFAVPLSNEFSIEKNEGGLFYHTDLSLAENELAMAGMVDVDNDSVVEAPNGSEICFTLSYPFDIAGMNQTAAIVSANLLSAGINNTLVPIQYSVLQNGIGAHDLSFNLAIYHQVMDEYGFGWVATTFLNSKRQVVGENVANIDDSRLSQLAIEYGDNIVLGNAKTIGLNAVRAVRDLCPIVPLFAYRWLSVYSDARFQGWANDTYAGAFSAWNPITITAKGGMPNEMRVAVLPSFFDRFFTSLNPFGARLVLDNTWISKSLFNPYLLVYDSSLETIPNGRAVPRLATSWDMLFLGLVSDLNTSESRPQYYIDPNAHWTDNVPVDSQDYRFTFEYYANYSMIAGSSLIVGVKTLGDHVAGINYNSLDMFSYRAFGALPILPRHIWQGRDPFTWEPAVGDAIGSGPFKVLSFSPHSSLVLTINAAYYPVSDTEPPKLKSIQIIPDNPTPAEAVVLRANIDDRSEIRNVTLHYAYLVGSVGFNYSTEMELGALGYETTIPARVTATTVYYAINATDVWGNSAIVASGSYSRPTTTSSIWQALSPYVALASIVGALVSVALVLRLRNRHPPAH